MIIKSAMGDYGIDFYQSLKAAKADDAFCDGRPGKFFIVDEYFSQMIDVRGPVYLVDAHEDNKDLSMVHDIVAWMQMKGADKNALLIAIGGGIVQDLATMAAHIYRRGIKLMLVPTTLLAQADSCIGAKCGLNVRGSKNQIGCFHAPTKIVICASFLDTLDDLAIQSGWGEILKLLLIGGSYEIMKIAGLRGPHLPLLIWTALGVKKQYIEEDEFDQGRRVVLNYGHTFGHALEAVTANQVPHGVAVAWGIDVANYIGRGELGRSDDYKEIKQFIREKLPYEIPGRLTAEQLLAEVANDKKSVGDLVTMVFMERPGKFTLRRRQRNHLLSVVRDYLAEENVYPCT